MPMNNQMRGGPMPPGMSGPGMPRMQGPPGYNGPPQMNQNQAPRFQQPQWNGPRPNGPGPNMGPMRPGPPPQGPPRPPMVYDTAYIYFALFAANKLASNSKQFRIKSLNCFLFSNFKVHLKGKCRQEECQIKDHLQDRCVQIGVALQCNKVFHKVRLKCNQIWVHVVHHLWEDHLRRVHHKDHPLHM